VGGYVHLLYGTEFGGLRVDFTPAVLHAFCDRIGSQLLKSCTGMWHTKSGGGAGELAALSL